MNRLNRKLLLFGVCISFISLDLYAFYEVTDVLPNQQLLICKDYNQVKSGNDVKTYMKVYPKSHNDKKLKISDEIQLPHVGEKIYLIQSELDRTSQFHPILKQKEIGTATIVKLNLENEPRLNFDIENSSQNKMHLEKVYISHEENLEIQKDCLIAIPDNGLQVTGLPSVRF